MLDTSFLLSPSPRDGARSRSLPLCLPAASAGDDIRRADLVSFPVKRHLLPIKGHEDRVTSKELQISSSCLKIVQDLSTKSSENHENTSGLLSFSGGVRPQLVGVFAL